MAGITPPTFACSACNKTFVWKPELAGRQVKCKCGTPIKVPTTTTTTVAAAAKSISSSPLPSPAAPVTKPAPKIPPAPTKPVPVAAKAEDDRDEDDLYSLAADEAIDYKPAPRAVPVTAAAPKPARGGGGAGGIVPLPYRRGLTAREQAAGDALIDMTRDVYVPTALLLVGMALYVGYYSVHYHLTAGGITVVSLGLGVMTAFKAALLVGFALMIAGPLGVGFGGLWTAILKLAAIAVFTDGVTTILDAVLAKFAGGFGGGGFFGFGVIGFPIAMGIYWGLLIYLFSMDPGDSWIVVIVLSVFNRIVLTILVFVILNSILNLGGAAIPAAAGAAGSAPSMTAAGAELATRVSDLQDHHALREGREYIADGHQAGLKPTIDGWYANGCQNVWFEMSSADINGRRSAEGIIVQMPADKKQRSKCYELLMTYYDGAQIPYDKAALIDPGDEYIEVELRR